MANDDASIPELQNHNHEHVPQDFDEPVEHPGVSTELDDEDEGDSGSAREPSIESIQITPQQPLPRSKSVSSSTRSRTLVIVPRSERRGLLARLTIIPEVTRPHDYENGTKWMITLIIALAAVVAPMGSAIFYPALPQIAEDLNTTATIGNLSVAMYMLSLSIFPLWWSSFSETLGRRTIYVTSFTAFVILNSLSAISNSIGMLIVMRVLSGGSAASVQAVGAGTIADVWEPRERGRAMGIFYLGPLMGPLIAPIVGGALAQTLGWRSTQWFLTIYGAVLLLVLTFCLPETLPRKKPEEVLVTETNTSETQPSEEAFGQAINGNAEVSNKNVDIQEKGIPIRSELTRISTRQSVHVKTKRWAASAKRFFIDPLSVLLYLRFPPVLFTVYYASITFGSLYVLNISVQQTFSEKPYNFSVIIVGLLYIPCSIGYFVASLTGGRWTDRIMHREARAAGRYDEKGRLILRPEDRMRENAWIAAVVYPAAFVMYGWTADKGIIWIVPMIANFFFGLGSMLIFGMSTTMLTEFMPKKSSSGVAVNNFVRNICSCVGGVVAQPLITAIGDGWLFTGLAIICWCSGLPIIWAMKKYGPKWRKDMDIALNSS